MTPKQTKANDDTPTLPPAPPPPSHTIENFVELTALVREFRKASLACETLASAVDRWGDAAPSPDDVLPVEMLPAALEALLPFTQDSRVAALLGKFTAA